MFSRYTCDHDDYNLIKSIYFIPVFTLRVWTSNLLTIFVLNFQQVHLTLDDVSTKCWMSDQLCRHDQMSHSAASYLGLHYLLRPSCPNTNGKYCIYYEFLYNDNFS